MIEWTKTETGECENISNVPKGAIIDAVDEKICYGLCESCLKPILEGDKFFSDEDGILLHAECVDS